MASTDIMIRIAADVKDYEKGLKKAESATNKLRETAAANAFKIAGVLATVGTGMLGVAALAVKAAATYETAFTGIRKTTDATDKQFAQLDKGIINLSKNSPASAKEIANVAAIAGQLGIPIGDMLKFTKVSTEMGIATVLSAEDSAFGMARFANIMDMPIDNVDRLASTIVHLGNNFAAQEDEILAMSLRMAGASNAVGMTESDVMALSTALSAMGIKSEAGGSAASRALLMVNDSVSVGGKDLKRYSKVAGMTNDEFAKMWKTNPAGAFNEVVKGLSGIREEGGDVNAVLKDMGFNDIRVKNSMLALSGGSDILTDTLKTGNTAWEENVALTDEVETRYSDLEQQMKILKNNGMAVVLAVGAELLLMLKDFITYIMPLVKWIGDLGEKFTALTSNTKGTIIILMIIIPIVILLVAAFMAISAVLTLVGTTLGAAFVVFFALFAKVIGITLLVVAAVVAIVIAIRHINWGAVGEAAKKAWNATIKWIKDAYKAVVDFATDAIMWIIDLWDSLVEGAKKAWSAVMDFFAELGESIIEILAGVRDGIYAAWDGMLEWFSNLWTGILDGIVAIWDSIIEMFGTFYDKIVDIFTPAVEFFTGLWDKISEPLMNIIDAVVDYFSTAWESIMTIITNVWEIIKNLVVGFVALMLQLVTGNFEEFYIILFGVMTNLRDAFKNIWQAIKDVFNSAVTLVVTFVLNYFNIMRTTMSTIFKKVVELVIKAFTKLKSGAISAVKALIKWVVDGFLSLKKTTTKTANDIKTGVTNAKTNMKNAVIRVFVQLFTAVTGKINDIKTSVTTTFTNIKTTVTTTAKGLLADLIGVFVDLFNQTREKFDEIKEAILSIKDVDLKKIGGDIIKGLITGIKNKVKAVGDAVKDVTSAITGKLKGILKIKSPSRVIKNEVGQQIMAGLIAGIKGQINPLESLMNMVTEAATPDLPTLEDFDLANMGANAKRSALKLVGKGANSSDDSRGDSVGQLLSEIRDELRNQKQMIVEMDSREVGRLIEPVVSESQERNKRREGAFSG